MRVQLLKIICCMLLASYWIGTGCSDPPQYEAIQEHTTENKKESVREPDTTEIPNNEPSPERVRDTGAERVKDTSAERVRDAGVEPPREIDREPILPEQTTQKKTLIFPPEGGTKCALNVCIKASAEAVKKKTVTVHVSETTGAPIGSYYPPMDIGPDNWKPAEAVHIIFSTKGLKLPQGASYEQLRVAFVSNGRWEPVFTVYDAQKQEVRGETTHFSIWGLVLAQQSCQTDATCLSNETCTGNQCTPECTQKSDCQSNEICVVGSCTACTATFDICGDKKDNDCDGQVDENCRKCGNCLSRETCGADGLCENGIACGVGKDNCLQNGTCVDIASDAHNCGACGVVCKLTEGCTLGNCTPLP